MLTSKLLSKRKVGDRSVNRIAILPAYSKKSVSFEKVFTLNVFK